MLKTNLAILSVLCLAGSANAATPTPPSFKPPIVYSSSIVSSEDAATLRAAFDAADRRDWSAMRIHMELAKDSAVKDLILWRLATGSETLAGFDMLNTALGRLEGWPRMGAVMANAEEAIAVSALSSGQRVAWFEAKGGAVSGDGKIAYAEALRRSGRQADALVAIKDAWENNLFSRETEREILNRYGSQLSPKDYETRINFLLWARQTSAARRLRGNVSSDYRALMDARIALIANQRGVDGKIDAVPGYLQSDPGLLYDRARWRRRRARNQPGATELLVQINGADVPAIGRDNLWDERNIAVRAALKDGAHLTAYRLSAPHGMSAGADFADAEWTAGWVALRLQNDAERALGHFETLRNGVSTPISLSRADYWYGRALKELGRTEEANAAFKAAAVHNYAYYGQLAAEEIGETRILLAPSTPPTELDRIAFYDRSVIKALRLLGEASEKGLFRQFSYHIDDLLETSTEQLLLSEIAADYQSPDIGVRGAKAGLGRGVIAPEAAYPVVSYPLQRPVGVENSLVLALSRQESELNPRAISHANARGLMQMLPRTAREQARREGLPYRVSWLTDDPGYNMTLGASHLDDLLVRFNGSYIMTAAAYNAGASRPARWVEEYGDPRKGEIDPVDWVEFIPFSETRNYVQRVLENVQVYRHRISGEATDIRIRSDLERGKF